MAENLLDTDRTNMFQFLIVRLKSLYPASFKSPPPFQFLIVRLKYTESYVKTENTLFQFLIVRLK